MAGGIAGRVVLGVALVLGMAAGGSAQTPLTDFAQLPMRVRLGDTVCVTDSTGRQNTGLLFDLTPSSLVLEAAGKRTTYPAEHVKEMSWRRPDSLRNGALAGMSVGIAFVGVLALEGCEDAECLPVVVAAMVVYAGMGAGVGAGIDALIPGKKIPVYSRAAGSARSRVSVSPILHPRRQGIAATVRF